MNEQRPNNGTRKKKKKFTGPESDFYDKCKGQMIRIEFIHPGRKPLVARLDWVDLYTIGLRDVTSGRKIMMRKTDIHTIQRDDDNGSSTATSE
jgi:hypothetical protein